MVTERLSQARSQFVILGWVSGVVCGLAGIVSLSGSPAFRPFFGDIPPLVAIAAVVALATGALAFLVSHGWCDIYDQRVLRRGLVVSATLATLLAIPIILVDVSIVFPPDINVPPPQALLFYPVMGYVAETVFHLVPVSLLLIGLPLAFRHISRETALWTCVMLVSLLEPIFQLTWAPSRQYPAWADAYVGLHVYVFNAIQLYVFKRFDFLSMYAFRLVYYLQWHIVWGYLRLQVLF